ncbi:hypothetical protein [Sphingobium sp. CFD-2]|uniref:hypothetical protein n=1 Tax=Sphingobium sp. CFD-2 TaxID=2878542 RepID=UPI00214C6B7E|nr:hypothetical protein [Sphingobium sp. CFD-2]
MSRTFTQQEFYDLVWSKPMTHLAKEFALSDLSLPACGIADDAVWSGMAYF